MKLHIFGHKSETEQSTEVSQNQNSNKTKQAIGGVLLASSLVAGTIAGANTLAPEAEKTSVSPNEQAPAPTTPEQTVVPGATLEPKPVVETTPTPEAPKPAETYEQPTEEKTEPTEPIDMSNDAVEVDPNVPPEGFNQPETPVDLGNDAVEQYPEQPVEPQPTDLPEQPVQ